MIDIEENRPAAASVQTLIERHDAGIAIVRLAATTAAENQPDGSAPRIAAFQRRVVAAGLDHLEILKPVVIWDYNFTYWDWAVWGNESTGTELEAIHNVLFPDAPFDHDQAVPDGLPNADRAERKWRNQRLDGLGLHTHIQAGADVYVTSDQNFFKETKKSPLAALGAHMIMPPHEAVAYLDSL
ncbi:hypothetical protein [Kitasatospora paracochleata]|uniref:PIN domain-containing protein n=1 Tax=Kitasatospora paracochleata TaxID=58354 RepID=A0ABT1JA18_9ACTN|nr:hypothetical protein [Kitasatospora paracochleata]MCP2314297.1 hypothetical protein [Kitasatospora paracochleata]